jgi:uncharacterized protein DUF5681
MTNSGDSSYKVGYGRPPLRSQFKPGQSGNPSGRPKRRRTFKMDFLAALDALESGPGGKKTQQQGMAEDLVKRARAWNALAVKIVVPLAMSINNDEGNDDDELTDQQQELLDDFNRRQESADLPTQLQHGGEHEPKL